MKITINYRYIVGINISKKTLDVHLFDRAGSGGSENQVANDTQGFAELGQWLGAHNVDRSQVVLCSEHCGRYGEQLLRWTTEADWPHAVVKTTALQKVGPEHHRKDDAWDAQGLAQYARCFSDRLSLTEAPKPAVGQLGRLRAERRKMVDRRGALKAKCSEAGAHDADMRELLSMWEQQIELLREHIEQINRQINELVNQDPSLSHRRTQLRTAPGMGPVVSCFWLSLFAGEQQLDPRKIASRFGFAPHGYESGSSVSKPTRSSGFGNSDLRRVFHQAARSVANHKPHYRQYYERKIAEGKHELVVINNIINKLIDLCCAMWNNNADYDPNHSKKMKKKWKKSA